MTDRSRRVEATADIDAPAADVWAVLEDVRRLPELSDGTVEVRDAPPRLTAVGQTFCQVVELGGRRFEARWTVTDLTPGRRVVVEGEAAFRARYRLDEQVEPITSGRSRVTIAIDYALPFGPLGRVVARLGAERRVVDEARQVVGNLRRLVERSPAR